MQHTLRRFKASIFQALSYPALVQIVELLRDGEKSVGFLINHIGVKQPNASQHFAVLRSRQIIISRKERNYVYCLIRDPQLFNVFDDMRHYFETQLMEVLVMFKEIKRAEENH